MRLHNNLNNQLESYGLISYQHRFLNKVLTFAHKIVNEPNAPVILKSQLVKLSDMNKGGRVLKNMNQFNQPGSTNHYGELTFSYFFSRLINRMCISDINLSFDFFKHRIFNNINIHFLNFISFFPKFDILYKNFDFIKKKQS